MSVAASRKARKARESARVGLVKSSTTACGSNTQTVGPLILVSDTFEEDTSNLLSVSFLHGAQGEPLKSGSLPRAQTPASGQRIDCTPVRKMPTCASKTIHGVFVSVAVFSRKVVQEFNESSAEDQVLGNKGADTDERHATATREGL